jgi:hypothetical protein
MRKFNPYKWVRFLIIKAEYYYYLKSKSAPVTLWQYTWIKGFNMLVFRIERYLNINY